MKVVQVKKLNREWISVPDIRLIPSHCPTDQSLSLQIWDMGYGWDIWVMGYQKCGSSFPIVLIDSNWSEFVFADMAYSDYPSL